MNYKLVKSSNDDIEKLIDYKKRNIYEYAKDLSDDEIKKINNYVEEDIPKILNKYSSIIIDNNVVGCLLLIKEDDGILLDEIYLEEEYSNKGIGTDIMKKVLNDNEIVYLWVYKDNIRAISLYKRLGFIVIDDKGPRYYMMYSNN